MFSLLLCLAGRSESLVNPEPHDLCCNANSGPVGAQRVTSTPEDEPIEKSQVPTGCYDRPMLDLSSPLIANFAIRRKERVSPCVNCQQALLKKAQSIGESARPVQ